MSISRIARGSKEVARVSPLDQPAGRAVRGKVYRPKKRRFDVTDVDMNRMHLSVDELKRFFREVPRTSFWYPYFFLQYFYGCRLSEPALILDNDVNFRRKKIVIRRLKKPQEAEGYKEFEYDADPRVLEAVRLAQQWKEQKGAQDNPFLFASNRRRAPEGIGAERLSQLRNLDGKQAVSRFTANRVFRQIGYAVKLQKRLIHSQVLRHTRAVVMLASGVGVEDVCEALGHSSLKMTERYIGVARVMADLELPDSDLNNMGLGV